MVMINIAKQFSSTPGGRFYTDGPYSGQKFRDEVLVPALKTGDRVEVVLDGVRGYGSSFLEEAFGGLIRLGQDKVELAKRLSITVHSPMFKHYKDLIEMYIEKAAAEQ